jgi:hypothetical protein
MLIALCAMSWAGLPAVAQTRAPWADAPAPVIQSVVPKAGNPARMVLTFLLPTNPAGADRGTAEMLDQAGGVLAAKPFGKTKNDVKTVEFSPPKSGTYSFRVKAARSGERAQKVSETETFAFSLPLEKPAFGVLNAGGGALSVKWSPVQEAVSYEVAARSLKTGAVKTVSVQSTETILGGLVVGEKYDVAVEAVRGMDRARGDAIGKTVRRERDREWGFAWFGQSAAAEANTLRMIDSDNLKFRLTSCTLAPDGAIERKGGKFTAFHDGISYYYTAIDPKKENFELSATFTVDYINPTADGQEGFGLLAMDSLGVHGVNMKNHYTNSAGIIATKFEATIAGVKKTSKDTLGARFVTGLTPQVLAMGDKGIAEYGTSVSKAYSYDSFDLVKAGESYRLTLKKTNTGYHAVLDNPYAGENAITEYILYGPEKLLQLDKDRIYVGFAAARGCNVTVSDVSMVITDPAADPPAMSEPPELVPLAAKVDSPATYTDGSYPFVFNANADGEVTVVDGKRRTIVAAERVAANVDFHRIFRLERGMNDYTITFAPDPTYRPEKNQVMAAYDRELLQYVESYRPITLNHSVIYHYYDQDALYVSRDGSFVGKGTPDDPMDLATALLYSRPGQPIILAGGVYYPERSVVIPRGNDGKPDKRKVLRSAPGERAIFDFGLRNMGMQLWGDYWTIENIDVRNTGDNVKGLQVGGSRNVLSGIATYRCGDTGLQISGTSAEPYEKWPAHNLVLDSVSYDNCDPAANNADGFAAKLTCGDGNVFRGCIAYSNIDDGWDLFSKIESGPIGAVLIENCVAYKNGSLSDGSGNGDGNGFKLGGDGIAVPHLLRNSVAFANGASGITSNSDPAIILEGNTSFGNKGSNIALYGKGDGSRLFAASRNISMNGSSADNYREMPDLASPDNFFWDGARSVNSAGQRLGTDIFVSVDLRTVPERRPDGSIDMKGFLVLNDKAPAGIGARLK